MTAEPSPAVAPRTTGVLRQHSLRTRRLVLIGYGPVAARLVDELRPAVRAGRVSVLVVGAEQEPAYNRILIGDLAFGRTAPDLLQLSDPAELAADGISVRLGVAVTAIDRERKYVTLADGDQHAYDELIFATGARARVPALPGLPRDGAAEPAALPDGVGVLRDLADAARVAGLAGTGGPLILLGGGVLGMELALAAAELDVPTTLVHTGRVPMERNLDPTAAALVSRHLRQRRITVLADATAAAVRTTGGSFSSLDLTDGRRVAGSALVLCCGATARTGLADSCGLATEAGIVVDHELRSVTDPAVWAIGDCARVHCRQPDCRACADSSGPSGLIATGWAQAEWLAGRLIEDTTDRTARPAETPAVMVLKSSALSVVSAGRVDREPLDALLDDDDHRVAQWSDPVQGRYVKMITRDGVLTGLIAVGMPRTAAELTLLYQRRGELPSDRSTLLRHDGPDHVAGTAADDPDRVLCRCNAVTQGRVTAAIAEGDTDLAAIGRSTRAGTGCGTCKERICELLDTRQEVALT